MAALFRSLRLVGSRTVIPTRVAAPAVQSRKLHLHEAYSLELMKGMGINVPACGLAQSPSQAVEVAHSIGKEQVVVKAQVLAGGRGKGHFENGFQGGVHLVKGDDEIRKVADQMIGHQLITKQTGSAGRPCDMVLVVETLDIIKEYYFAIMMDRSSQGPMIIASNQGGMDIEAVAEENPDAIIKVPIDMSEGLTPEKALQVAKDVGFSPQAVLNASKEMLKLYSFFMQYDCSMVEINPMALDSFGDVRCLDAKINYDDNSAFRQKEVFEKRDLSQENKLDVVATQNDLNYIGLDGNIGCLVNGAGLAMSTMDIIELYGGKPANFLDIGGGATAQQVTEAFKIITTDPQVTSILVNIFGGIMRCDVIAEGIISACAELELKVPVVVRLQGTQKNEAKALIAASGLDILSADELDEAAQKAVQVSRIAALAKQANLSVKFKELVAHPNPTGNVTPNL